MKRILENASASSVSGKRADETLAGAWENALALIAPSWSDLLVELDLSPEVDLLQVAALVSPLNPERCAGRSALRFRVAHDFGYGVSPSLAHRCLARLDEAGVRGSLRFPDVLSNARAFFTLGPVFRSDGRSL